MAYIFVYKRDIIATCSVCNEEICHKKFLFNRNKKINEIISKIIKTKCKDCGEMFHSVRVVYEK